MSADPRYPIGKFQYTEPNSPGRRARDIEQIRTLPARLASVVEGMTAEQLATPYREGGWTVLQTVHHLADSHMNSFIRCKLALTEENPTIKPYLEDRWATLPDSAAPAGPSLQLLEGLHARWTALWESLEPAAYQRPYVHPVSGPQNLDRTLALYAWHGEHHLAHIRN